MIATAYCSHHNLGRIAERTNDMSQRFKVGDHVTWNSEAGHVSGKIIKVHTKNVPWKGYTHHASDEEPQYEIESDKTNHIAMHKGTTLKKMTESQDGDNRERQTRHG